LPVTLIGVAHLRQVLGQCGTARVRGGLQAARRPAVAPRVIQVTFG